MENRLPIDSSLLQEARRLGAFTSDAETIDAALRILIERHRTEQNRLNRSRLRSEGDLEAFRKSF